MVNKRAIKMGMQLPESAVSNPLPQLPATKSNRIKIQRQVLLPLQENKFISSSRMPQGNMQIFFLVPCGFIVY
jgi:hypothetical protein